MRIEAGVLTVSWIPSEAVTGANKVVFASGFTHYDDPPPDRIPDLAALLALRDADAFRFANHLRAWVEVVDGRVRDAGFADSSGCVMGATTLRLGPKGVTFSAVPLADLRTDPERTETSVRFTQTVGGHTAVPAPRRVNHPPFVKLEAPTVWTTLALTIHADGRVEHELTGASPFPRHWVYDADGRLAAKAGLAAFKDWYRHAFGKHTPWGDRDTPALVTQVESSLERELATQIMRRGEKPAVHAVKEGRCLTEQGASGTDLYLLLDGVLDVEVDGEPIAEVGPGAILGERAALEGGQRTATLRARTRCRVAVATHDQLDLEALAEVSELHRREEG